MILRDYYCICGHEMSDEPVRPRCPECGRVMQVICNGGCGHSRYRFADLPPGHDPWWKGQVTTVGADCSHDGDFNEGAPVVRCDGTPVTLNQDRAAERRDRAYHSLETRHGQTRLYFDGARRR